MAFSKTKDEYVTLRRHYLKKGDMLAYRVAHAKLEDKDSEILAAMMSDICVKLNVSEENFRKSLTHYRG